MDLLARAEQWDARLKGVHTAAAALDAAVRTDAPLPGDGDTLQRWEILAGATAVDAAVGRLVEGHLDAIAILREAERDPRPHRYGVWASRARGQRVVATRGADGWGLSGSLPFSSGAGTVERALIVADTDSDGGDKAEARLLVEVDVEQSGVDIVPGTWPSIAMSATDSLTVTLNGVRVDPDDVIGAPGFYTERDGFWYGSIGVAACWAGAAAAVADHAIACSGNADDPHRAAHFGELHASVFAMSAVLDSAARQLDGGALADRSDAETAALTVRHLIEREAENIVHHAGRAGGASLLAHDPDHAHRVNDLLLYIRQSHGERDLARLGSTIGARYGHVPGR
jgi:hypothetical protein